jgi:hypothetical protein
MRVFCEKCLAGGAGGELGALTALKDKKTGRMCKRQNQTQLNALNKKTKPGRTRKEKPSRTLKKNQTPGVRISWLKLGLAEKSSLSEQAQALALVMQCVSFE